MRDIYVSHEKGYIKENINRWVCALVKKRSEELGSG